MEKTSYITDRNGNKTEIADLEARANATSAVDEAEYDRQDCGNVYAGRNLATLFADEIAKAGGAPQWLNARAKAGNFTGMRIGDWIDIALTNGSVVRYVVAAFDHYYNCGDAAMGHHIVMVPTAAIPVSGDYAVNGSYIMWNTTNNNNGKADETSPYLASNLHKWEAEVFLPLFPAAWQNVMRNHRSLVETRYSASGTLTEGNNWKWADLGKIWSPSEMEVYGCLVWGTKGWSQGMDSQFPLFRETKNRIRPRVTWWLRSGRGGSSTHACYVHAHGHANYGSCTYTWIRPLPCFLVGA